jgi:hypothetical protein
LTLASYDNAIEAHLLRSKLASEGIHAFVFDENIITLNLFHNIPAGGVKVKVMESDLTPAMRCLQRLLDAPLLGENNQVLVCPSCKSDKIFSGVRSIYSITGIFAAVVSWMFIVIPPFLESRLMCKLCGKTFRRQD